MLVTTDGSLRRPTGFRSQSISVIMMDVVHSSHICVTENRNKNEKQMSRRVDYVTIENVIKMTRLMRTAKTQRGITVCDGTLCAI